MRIGKLSKIDMTNDLNGLAEKIWSKLSHFEKELIEFRRHFHQFPELSWKEFRTAERITSLLKGDGYVVNTGICKTGVVAEFIGSEGGKTIAIRSDMDALPMYDAKDVPYASRIPGVMHACGHDVHMALVIGVAKILKRLNVHVPGKVRLIFQPSEEASPSGAEELVRAGVMEGVDSVFAFHVDPEIQTGKIGLREGIMTAHCDEFKLTIQGRSGHAARPHHTIDTIYLSNQILSALYDIAGNRTHSFVPAVLTVGRMDGGTKSNVIPERVDIQGTVRTIDEETRKEIIAAIEQRVQALTRAAGGRYQLEFSSPIPPVINDSNLLNLVRTVGVHALSSDGVVDIKDVSMGGEDFSWYLKKAPGVLIRLGVRRESEDIKYLHTNTFDVDERAIAIGTAVMTMVVLKYFDLVIQ
ncbi:MAG: M20 family metallopeptidase [bacterium]